MKSIKFMVILGALAFLAACAQEVKQPEANDAWEVPERTADAPAGETTASSSAANSQENANLLVTLKGSEFVGESTTSSVHGDVLRVGHYFVAEAPFELTTSATQVETHLTGIAVEEALPLIGLQIISTSGKYQSHDLGTRPINGEQHLKDSIALAPGSYKMVVQYFKDTVGGKRPHIVVHKAEFRKEPE